METETIRGFEQWDGRGGVGRDESDSHSCECFKSSMCTLGSIWTVMETGCSYFTDLKQYITIQIKSLIAHQGQLYRKNSTI